MSTSERLAISAQARLLTDRYWAVTRGDWATLVLVVGQAPFIGWLCAVVWGSIEDDTPSLYFVLTLSAVWFGCISACREIVKERAILERERFFGLSIPAYVASKLVVLCGVTLAQVVLLQGAVEWKLALRGAYLVETFALWGTALCGVGLGLLISALASRQDRAVAVVPLLLLPQILFSEFAIPREAFGEVVAFVEKLMPVHWGYEIFDQAAAMEPDWWQVVLSFAALGITTVVLYGLTVLALLPRREIA